MRRLVALLALSFAWTLAPAQTSESPVQSLDQLLESVLKQREVEEQELARREQRFLAERDNQQQLLAEAKAKLAAEEARGATLRSAYEANAGEIARARDGMKDTAGELSELQGIVRQIAGDLEGMLQSSMISVQLPDRAAAANAIARRPEMPSMQDLETLWHLMLQEAVESGKVVKFPAPVVAGEGQEQDRTVTRVGVFTAVTGGHFLRYLPETGKLLEPGRQPPSHYQRMAADLEQATAGVVPVPVDPSRGAILALLIQSPDVIERIRQAGAIGYLILALGGFALLNVIERFIVLSGIRRRVVRQRQTDGAAADNPLGRLRQVERASPQADAETLGLKLDQTIMKEIPRLRRRLPMLAVVATAAPLLGLLGTVAGMIETFQSMTLFGAGDPKVVSGGISLALVATELGLVIAIPILLLHGWLHGISNQIIHVLEEEIATLVARREETIHAASAP